MSTLTKERVPDAGVVAERRDELLREIEHAAHLLPTQGPITVFVHHNTLHAFEHTAFDDGVQAGGRLFGCHAYLSEDRYRQELEGGRIRIADLEAVLWEDLGDDADLFVAQFGTRYALRLAMLQYPVLTASSEELRWVIAETDALRRFRAQVTPDIRERLIESTRRWVLRVLQNGSDSKPVIDVLDDVWDQFDRGSIDRWSEQTWEAFTLNFLWRVCRHGVHQVKTQQHDEPGEKTRRHRDILMETTGQDADLLVHEVLISFCAAFLDQGFADWELPDRGLGFYRSFLNLHSRRLSSPTRWLRRLSRESRRLNDAEVDPLESIEESLRLLGVGQDECEAFLTQSLLALRGWAGMIWQMETNAEWAPHPAPEGSLVEYLAVRLLLDRVAIEAVARDSIGFVGPLNQLRDAVGDDARVNTDDDSFDRAFAVFQMAQVRGWQPQDLQHLSSEQWTTLIREIDAFSQVERRRVFHKAYERKYRNEALDAVTSHSRVRSAGDMNGSDKSASAFQVVCCIDDREESFRRHLEECEPECETYGVAGFYGTAMYYRGTSDAHFRPLCPVAIKPQHYVTEEPLYSLQADAEFRAVARRRLGQATLKAHLGSRGFLGGIITTLAGSLAAFPLVARILFPRLTSRLRQLVGHIVQPPSTQLRLERLESLPGPENGQLGYSVDEMTSIVEGVLKAIGLTRGWSRLIALLGHGSTSLNNPHESAYGCGACSGGQGGPNARAFAQMANDHRIRKNLQARGLLIPEDTYFIGGYHDTTNDSVRFFDLDRLPVSHRADFERLWTTLGEVRRRNAHERCRMFDSVRFDISPAEALRHVEGRPQDLSQARPEYNHATNALCFVGRRQWSRGLFLDRRAFLTSYDPTQDDDRGTILKGILQAVIPVCAGISLEYYFSTVDVEGYGCGSKLPHNITSLLGVMSGAASDLRPGLSAQMVEIHEPMRILFVVETTPEIMTRIIQENQAIAFLVDGDWVQLAVYGQTSNEILRYVNGEFILYEPESRELPTVASSKEWYSGQRDHLGFAEIVAGKGAPDDA